MQSSGNGWAGLPICLPRVGTPRRGVRTSVGAFGEHALPLVALGQTPPLARQWGEGTPRSPRWEVTEAAIGRRAELPPACHGGCQEGAS
jgi:hypothetical protein